MNDWGLSKKLSIVVTVVGAALVGAGAAKDPSVAVAWIWCATVVTGLYVLGQGLVDAASAKKP